MKELKKATSLRFFFALWVFLSHCDFIIGTDSWAYRHIFQEGYIGVGFFFILSGFILSYVYQDKIQRKLISYREFILLRLFRIYPLYFVTLLLAIPLVGYATGEFFITRFLSHVFMLQSFIPAESFYFGFNGPAWSVSNELFFYLLFPFLIVRFPRAASLLAGIVVMSLATLFDPHFGSPDGELVHYLFYINPLVRLADFIFGMALFKMMEGEIKLPQHSMIIGLIVLILFFELKNFIPENLWYSQWFYFPMMIIILAAADQRQRSFIDTLLGTKILVYLGKISYGLYLYHIPVLRFVTAAERRFEIELHPLVNIGLCLTVLILISALSYEFFENPLNQKLRKIFISPDRRIPPKGTAIANT
jgi:peptidoglycan/LPS O-acetylase OafA/YrhL